MSELGARDPSAISPPLAPRFAASGRRRPGPLTSSGAKRRLLVAGCLAAGDLFSGLSSIVIATALATRLSHNPEVNASVPGRLLTSITLLMACYFWLGLYRTGARSLLERFRLRVMALILFIFAETLLSIHDGLSAGLLIAPMAGALILMLGSWTEQFIVAQLIRREMWGVPTAILDSGESGRMLARLLTAHPDWGLKPVGYILDENCSGQPVVETKADEPVSVLPLLGVTDGRQGAGRAEVLAIPDPASLPSAPNVMHRFGFKRVVLINQVGEIPTFGMQLHHFDRCVALELQRSRRSPSQLVKRLIDLAVTLPFAALSAPLVVVLAALIKAADPGPAFYGQWRIGCQGRAIRVLKLRTMYCDADQRLDRVLHKDPAAQDEWNRYFKLSNDPRILPGIGSFLRRTSLDELPQLWNIIRGDMSLVGPRPFPAYHMNAFDPEFQALRISVPPGLTGLWQISSRSNGDLEVQRSQDCFYIRNRSLWLDMYILLATLPAVISSQGAK